MVLAIAVLCGNSWASELHTQQDIGDGDAFKRNDSQHLAADEAVRTAKRRIEAGQPQEALTVLRRAMKAARISGVDTTAIRFMAAQALMKMHRHVEAAAILEQLAEKNPTRNRIQLDYAAVLFMLGRDNEAEAIFRDMRRRENLPPAVRRNVERFLERIRARQRWRIDLDIGFWRDNNVNNASELETVEVPLFGGSLPIELNERPVRAWVARTGARLRWREPVMESERAYIETRASVARNTAVGASAHNRTWLNLSTGPRLGYAAKIAGRQRPGLVRTDLGAEWRWRGGESYAESLWAEFGVDQALTGDWRTGIFSRFWITRYDGKSEEMDPHGRSFGLHLSHRIGPGWLTARGTLSHEKPKQRSLRWTSRETSLVYTVDFKQNWHLSVRAKLNGTTFDGEHPLFLIHREDKTHGLGLTVSHRSLVWRSYLPEIILSWARTTSTIPLYDREFRTVHLELRRLF